MSLLQQTIAGLSKNAFSGSHLPFFNCYKDKNEHFILCSLVQSKYVLILPYEHKICPRACANSRNIDQCVLLCLVPRPFASI